MQLFLYLIALTIIVERIIIALEIPSPFIYSATPVITPTQAVTYVRFCSKGKVYRLNPHYKIVLSDVCEYECACKQVPL